MKALRESIDRAASCSRGQTIFHCNERRRRGLQFHRGNVAVTLCVIACLTSLALTPNASGEQPQQIIRLTSDGLLKQRPVWSPDSRQLVFARHRGSQISLQVLDFPSLQERRLTSNQDPEFDAAFSPDGTRLLLSFDKASPNQGDIDIYSVDADGKNFAPCVTTQGQLSHEEWPSWSPDGKRFAFTSTRYGNQELCLARADGKEEVRLTTDPALDLHPAWSPDGKQIAFATGRWGDLEIAVIDPEGKNLKRLTESRGLDDYPVWSPDGKSIAFASNRNGDLDVYRADAHGGNPRNMTSAAGIDTFPAFSPQGELTWVGQRAGGFDLYMLSNRAEVISNATRTSPAVK